MICENILFKEIASFADIDSVMMQNALIKGNLFVQINEMATKFYEDLLYSPGSESYREYLYSR